MGTVRAARLVRPSAVTHVTDVEQRSIKLDIERNGDGLDVTIPASAGLVPSGWYMLFVTDENGALLAGALGARAMRRWRWRWRPGRGRRAGGCGRRSSSRPRTTSAA